MATAVIPVVPVIAMIATVAAAEAKCDAGLAVAIEMTTGNVAALRVAMTAPV